MHFHANGPASLKPFPIIGAVAEFAADRLPLRQRPFPVVRFFRTDVQVRAAAFVAFQIQVEKRGDGNVD